MRIGIDARNDGTGVGRYTFSLVRELARLDPENEYVLLLNAKRFASYEAPGPNFRTVEADIPWFGLREQLQLPRLMGRERLDLVHFPHLTVPLLARMPFVVTIHDLNYLDADATARPAVKRAGYRVELLKAKRARRLIAVSEHTRGEIVRRLGVDPARIAVTYEAADAPAVKPDPDTLGRYGIDAPFFLYVGAAYPYKNLARLIEAFARVEGDYRLVLAGDQEEFGPALRAQASERVVFTGPVSEPELAALYAGALAYVFVSLSEGFGLPGLEAMAAGVPVVAAHAGSLPEVYDGGALWCAGSDTGAIAAALTDVAGDAEHRRRLIADGRKRAAEFSWARTAEQTLAVYREALLD
jgi:glycosyltransferase involved in cell wall biosynthesis